MKPLIDHQTLLEKYSYDPATGMFTRIRVPSRGRKRKAYEKPIGCDRPLGYKAIMISGATYLAHRLAFFYVHQRWPIGDIDHINGDTSDNRIANLREVDRSTNQHNRVIPNKTNKTGFLGVYRQATGKYAALLQVRKEKIYFGGFDKPEDAQKAYLEAKSEYGLRSSRAPISDSAP